MSAVHRRGPARIAANLTPMIDVTFLLIVFFVLVSQIVEVESVPLSLPELADPATAPMGEERRTVINVVPTSGGRAEAYRLGARSFAATPEGAAQLARELGALFAADPTLRVNLRADRGTRYEFVRPALRAVSEAAALSGHEGMRPTVQLVVLREE